jgi:RNA polymerase sigma-70 factor (ECF subfamily)
MPEVDVEIAQLCASGDYSTAASCVIAAYKLEISRFLLSRLRNDGDVHDVLSLFCEDVWRGLAAFHWRCSLRAWLYTLARNAQHRHRLAQRRHAHNVAIDDLPLAAADAPRTVTARCRQTGVKNGFRELRRRLPEEDQLLLQLRVERELSWSEIAYVTLSASSCSEVELARETARVRKRFQLIKARLRDWALEAGFLHESPRT